jgi:hypothetical protein
MTWQVVAAVRKIFQRNATNAYYGKYILFLQYDCKSVSASNKNSGEKILIILLLKLYHSKASEQCFGSGSGRLKSHPNTYVNIHTVLLILVL